MCRGVYTAGWKQDPADKDRDGQLVEGFLLDPRLKTRR